MAGPAPSIERNLHQRKPRSILIGRETLLGECGRLLQEQNHEIVAVVASEGPAAAWARRAGVPLFARSKELVEAGVGRADYLFSITNLNVLPSDVLALASRAAINFHDGLLPAYAGLNTPSWALLAGEAEHGVTWHLMTDDVDCGDVLASQAIKIEDGETSLSLNTKCFEAGLGTFAALVADLEAALQHRQPMPGPPERFFGKDARPVAAATIDWDASAHEIVRQISALDFGAYRNPLGVAKTLLSDRLVLVHSATVLDRCSGAAPGTIVDSGETLVVATGSEDIRLDRLADTDGKPLAPLSFLIGQRFEQLGSERQEMLATLDSAAARYEGWWHRRLAGREALLLPQFHAKSGDRHAGPVVSDCAAPVGRVASDLLAAWVAYLGRVADRDIVDIGYVDEVYLSRLEDVTPWFADQMPLHVAIDWEQPLGVFADRMANEVGAMHKRIAIARDLIARMPDLRGKGGFGFPVSIQLADSLDQVTGAKDAVLHLAIASDGSGCRLIHDPAQMDSAAVSDLWAGFETMLAAANAAPETPVGRLSLLGESEYHQVIRAWNAETAGTASVAGVHHMISEQARRTPGKVAVTASGRSMTYAELDAKANRLARYLHALGVGPDVMVGLNVERSVELAVCVLAIHKAGGAYVPLDPAYPRDRLAHMIADSRMPVIVTQSALVGDLPAAAAQLVCIDRLDDELSALSDEPFDGGATAENLVYVIYTSGSTGLPKGVMIEHRNLANFFAGMDRQLEPDGVWLAVTSLSFDISVLEICWPLTRGYHVVIATEREVRGDVVSRDGGKAPEFSLFYFASADGASAADHYRLLMEGARFADANGFEAVWTPERHFHAFGGPYPNPAVISAALAASTSRIKIRAGSVVATLHHPARIAEEWALVDNLSGGRVGIAFASGWQPNDFVFAPDNFADRNGALKRNMEDVRALWRGEARSFPGPLGDVELMTYPRPVQPELPVWITSAGNVQTFEEAGRSGANVLTHLLGQTVEEVGEKIAAYRRARTAAGHVGEGHVTLMLHSFVGENAGEVRSIVHGPLTEYLRTSTNLLKQYAWSFPTFKQPVGAEAGKELELSGLNDEETDALLEHAFGRYFETSGLFGTPEDCLPLIRRLQAIGVDEIGCLVDFGIATDTVLASLPALNRLRRLAAAEAEGAESSLPELMTEHGVTHLQCTPSLLNVLASDGAARPHLSELKRLMVGGEAFPPHLARDMVSLVDGAVMNMYGPTETTIWSATHVLQADDDVPPLGRPLLNQQVYVLDRRMQPVRPGTPGELIIAGDGVVRGYLDRPELTAERFIADPVDSVGRAYRTGDLVRQRSDGTLEFLGRLDHQVKVRGYRIELGEIEARLADHPDVIETVVVAHRAEGAADARLIAYLATTGGSSNEALRDHLRASLPEFMVPSAFIQIEALPRTPNGKIDRKALPDPGRVVIELPVSEVVEPASGMEAQIHRIWCDLLNLPNVGLRDNFFDIGGHSLLAVQLHRRLSAVSERPVSLTDIFRFPTVATLAAHLSVSAPEVGAAREGQDRANSRRAALQRRGAARALARS
ncbi:MupA/Atu3671 family FMN-dependent luciferase-like monooxygenase [Sphingopyxis fribergensis]